MLNASAALVPLVVVFFSSAAPGAEERFASETAISWSVKVERDGTTKTYTEGEIDSLPEGTLAHAPLRISCQIPLAREHIGYDPSGKRGYTRDEERVSPRCRVGDMDVRIETVTCAKGHARNKVGNVYGDSAALHLTSGKRSFGVEVRCVLK